MKSHKSLHSALEAGSMEAQVKKTRKPRPPAKYTQADVRRAIGGIRSALGPDALIEVDLRNGKVSVVGKAAEAPDSNPNEWDDGKPA
jgi:hypothetical protein